MNGEKTRYLYDALLFIVAGALYSPSLQCGFVGDDLIYFIGNRFIESFDFMTILRSGAIGFDYLPLRDLSLALDYQLWGKNPFGFHLTNVLLFALTAVIVKHLFLDLSAFLTKPDGKSEETPAFLAALIFAVHPNHREVVYAVYNRGALLTVLFSGLACLFFLRFLQGHRGRYVYYAAAFFCYLLALSAREYSIILPIALTLMLFFDDSTKMETHLMYMIPFFVSAAIFYGLYKEYAVAAGFILPSSEPLLSEIIAKTAVAAKISLFYLIRMVTSLGVFVFDDTLPLALLSISVVGGLLYVAYTMRRRYPHLLYGMLFYLICLAPVLNFFRTLPIVSPRYSFLACIGLFFILMAVPRVRAKKYILAACVILTLSWSLLTLYKTAYWRDNVSFWETMAARDKTASAFTQLGYAYLDALQYEKALETLRKVLPPPMDPRYHAAVGNACLTLGDYQCAITSFETASALGADGSTVPLNRARQYKASGEAPTE